MQISVANNIINISVTTEEAIEIIRRSRDGLEHIPSGTVPITLDIKTEVWVDLLKWAVDEYEELNPGEEDFVESFRESMKFRGDGFIILEEEVWV